MRSFYFESPSEKKVWLKQDMRKKKEMKSQDMKVAWVIDSSIPIEAILFYTSNYIRSKTSERMRCITKALKGKDSALTTH